MLSYSSVGMSDKIDEGSCVRTKTMIKLKRNQRFWLRLRFGGSVVRSASVGVLCDANLFNARNVFAGRTRLGSGISS